MTAPVPVPHFLLEKQMFDQDPCPDQDQDHAARQGKQKGQKRYKVKVQDGHFLPCIGLLISEGELCAGIAVRRRIAGCKGDGR